MMYPVSQSNAHALFSQMLSNMSKGVHPPSPTKKPSLLEHITRTRYSSLLKPAIAKAWKEQTRDNIDYDLETYRTGPSPSFCKKVLQDVLDALSEDDWKIINQEINDEWELAKERYRQNIMDLYGEHASEEWVALILWGEILPYALTGLCVPCVMFYSLWWALLNHWQACPLSFGLVGL